MPHPRTAKSNVFFVILAAVAFLISGLVIASPNPGTQQEHLISPPPQEGHLIPPRTSQPRGTALQALSSTEGIDFRTYLDSLYFSIRRNFLATIPESAARGKKESWWLDSRYKRTDHCLISPRQSCLARERRTWMLLPLARFARLPHLRVSLKDMPPLLLTCNSASTTTASHESLRRNQRSFPLALR
jgi:hypothetical protein